MTKIFGPKEGKERQKNGGFLAKITSKLLPITSDPKNFKIFLIVDITKDLGFRSNKNANFLLFLLFYFWIFFFQIWILLLEIFPTVQKLLNLDKYLKSYSTLKKVCYDKKAYFNNTRYTFTLLIHGNYFFFASKALYLNSI